MGKESNHGWRCRCGFESGKTEMKNHVDKVHADQPEIAFDIFGEVGNLKSANLLAKNLFIRTNQLTTDVSILTKKVDNLEKERDKLIAMLRAYERHHLVAESAHDLLVTTLNTLNGK